MTSDPVARYQTLRGAKGAISSRLRPMTPGEIIDTALRLYQRLGLTFLRLSVVPTLLCVASIAFVSAYVVPALLYGADHGDFTVYISQLVIGLVLAVFVGGPLFLAGLSYTTAMVVSLTSDYIVGNVPSTKAAQEAARKAMPRLLITTIRELVVSLWGIALATVILVSGLALARRTPDSDVWAGVLAVLGILGLFLGFYVWLAVAVKDAAVPPIVVLENLGARAAGKRSRFLLGKNPLHGPGTATAWRAYFLLGFIATVFSFSIELALELSGIGSWLESATSGSIAQPILHEALGILPTFLTLWVVIPVWATTITVLYIDRRIRLEGFDVEVLARNIARGTQTDRYQL